MPVSQLSNDTLRLEFLNLNFLNPTQNTVTIFDDNITNATTINIERDFFTPPDGLAFVIEDDRAVQFHNFMQRGMQVKVFINGNLNMIGYIFKYRLIYSKNGGTRLHVECKDLLEYLAQGTCYPNMGLGQLGYITNVHFGPDDTLKKCLQSIAAAFYNAQQGQLIPSDLNLINVEVDNSSELTIGSGFQLGLRVRGKKTAKNISTAIAHLTTPMPGESYLGYMLRLCKLAGCQIKASNIKPNTIIVKSPCYATAPISPFKIWHCQSAPNNQHNNVIEGDITYNLDHQPSVVIVEANTTGSPQFKMENPKGVAINALTGVQSVTTQGNQGTVTYIPSVTFAINNLTSGPLGVHYKVMDFNDDLYQQSNDMAVGIATNFSLPYYTVSHNAHTTEEAKFGAAEYLADCQDKYVELIYKVQGWTMPGTQFVWQPDMMCMVTDDILFPNSAQKPFPMWIRKVNFIKDRHNGTQTVVHLTLPYTHTIATYDDPDSESSSLSAAVSASNKTPPANTNAVPPITIVGSPSANFISLPPQDIIGSR